MTHDVGIFVPGTNGMIEDFLVTSRWQHLMNCKLYHHNSFRGKGQSN